ncbi:MULTISPECIES: PqqD family peptide modification chaperone [Actinosynnema]|uniref:PqqD family peptide modification chaperone n=1 Tax=Actinosynnema TaxID=40566 RepID=UPI0020A503E2|nr:PqqD family peptide modification chaperone [Actinosynnema pretiosum]MCP2100004.1 Coenzyme PQQ synthesis protein D (PqqD) [Actinosynnema pretiosum]
MWRLREGVHAVLTDEGGTLLDERTGRWTDLSPSASTAARLVLDADTEHRAVEDFAARYGLAHERAAADLDALARDLAGRGLLLSGMAGHQPPRWLRGWWR